MIIVSDTSPINYLVLIGEIELLPKLFGKVVIPQAVLDELNRRERPKLSKIGLIRTRNGWKLKTLRSRLKTLKPTG